MPAHCSSPFILASRCVKAASSVCIFAFSFSSSPICLRICSRFSLRSSIPARHHPLYCQLLNCTLAYSASYSWRLCFGQVMPADTSNQLYHSKFQASIELEHLSCCNQGWWYSHLTSLHTTAVTTSVSTAQQQGPKVTLTPGRAKHPYSLLWFCRAAPCAAITASHTAV